MAAPVDAGGRDWHLGGQGQSLAGGQVHLGGGASEGLVGEVVAHLEAHGRFQRIGPGVGGGDVEMHGLTGRHVEVRVGGGDVVGERVSRGRVSQRVDSHRDRRPGGGDIGDVALGGVAVDELGPAGVSKALLPDAEVEAQHGAGPGGPAGIGLVVTQGLVQVHRAVGQGIVGRHDLLRREPAEVAVVLVVLFRGDREAVREEPVLGPGLHRVLLRPGAGGQVAGLALGEEGVRSGLRHRPHANQLALVDEAGAETRKADGGE